MRGAVRRPQPAGLPREQVTGPAPPRPPGPSRPPRGRRQRLGAGDPAGLGAPVSLRRRGGDGREGMAGRGWRRLCRGAPAVLPQRAGSRPAGHQRRGSAGAVQVVRCEACSKASPQSLAASCLRVIVASFSTRIGFSFRFSADQGSLGLGGCPGIGSGFTTLSRLGIEHSSPKDSGLWAMHLALHLRTMACGYAIACLMFVLWKIDVSRESINTKCH